jgi:hypothetical protein
MSLAINHVDCARKVLKQSSQTTVFLMSLVDLIGCFQHDFGKSWSWSSWSLHQRRVGNLREGQREQDCFYTNCECLLTEPEFADTSKFVMNVWKPQLLEPRTEAYETLNMMNLITWKSWIKDARVLCMNVQESTCQHSGLIPMTRCIMYWCFNVWKRPCIVGWNGKLGSKASGIHLVW